MNVFLAFGGGLLLGFAIGWLVCAWNATTPCPDCNEGLDRAWGLLQESSVQVDEELKARIREWAGRYG